MRSLCVQLACVLKMCVCVGGRGEGSIEAIQSSETWDKMRNRWTLILNRNCVFSLGSWLITDCNLKQIRETHLTNFHVTTLKAQLEVKPAVASGLELPVEPFASTTSLPGGGGLGFRLIWKVSGPWCLRLDGNSMCDYHTQPCLQSDKHRDPQVLRGVGRWSGCEGKNSFFVLVWIFFFLRPDFTV